MFSNSATPLRRLLCLAAATGLVLGACSSDDEPATEEPGPTEAGDPETSTTSAEETTTTEAVPVGLAPDAPTRTITLPGDRVFPEGVAYDSVSGTVFVSSSDDGTIFSGPLADDSLTVFLEAGSDGRTSALGMAVDEERRRLWIGGGQTNTLFAYDVDTGELLAALPVPDPGSPLSRVNDVTVGPDGDAYATNSGATVLYRAEGSDEAVGELEIWLDHADSVIPSEGAILLNGIVATSSGHLLVVHTSTQQLFQLDPATGGIVEVDTGGAGVGADGLDLDGQTLYGVTPLGVVVTELGDDFATGVVGETVVDDSLRFATTVALVPQDRMLVVSSQFTAPDAPELPFFVSDLARGTEAAG